MSNVPVEIFLPLIGLSLSMGVLGSWKKIYIAMLIAGAIITFLAVDTNIITLGKIPITSTVSGSVTTYAFIDNEFIFTEWHKILMALIGSMFMFMGAMEWNKKEEMI